VFRPHSVCYATYAIDDVIGAWKIVSDAGVAQVIFADEASASHVQSEEDLARLLTRRDGKITQLLFNAFD